MKQTNVKPAEGKLGILVVGCGAVATTFMTGVFMARKGLAKPVGSMTQYDKIRVGKGSTQAQGHRGPSAAREEWSWSRSQYTGLEQGYSVPETQAGGPGGTSARGGSKVCKSCFTGKAGAVDDLGGSGEEEDLLAGAVGDGGI